MNWTWNGRRRFVLGSALAVAALLSACSEEPAPDAGGAPPPGAPEAGGAPPGAPADAAGAPAADAAGAPAAPAAAPDAAVAPAGEGAAPAGGEAAPPPGGPMPTPGGPIKFASFPPNIPSQDALKKKGNTITIKGMVLGDACKGKSIRLLAQQPLSKTGGGLATYLTLNDVGHYEMLVPKGETPIWLMAECDVNGDGVLTPGTDYTAAYAQNPIKPTAEASAVVLNLTNEKITVGMPKPVPGAGPGGPPPGGEIPPGSTGPGALPPADPAAGQGAAGDKQPAAEKPAHAKHATDTKKKAGGKEGEKSE